MTLTDNAVIKIKDLLAYSQGCWKTTKDNMIRIQWKDGDFSEFSPDSFIDTPDRQMQRQHK